MRNNPHIFGICDGMNTFLFKKDLMYCPDLKYQIYHEGGIMLETFTSSHLWQKSGSKASPRSLCETHIKQASVWQLALSR